VGEIELDGKILIIKRIHVHYLLRGVDDPDEETRAKIDRVHALHADFCPVARSIGGSIDITTDLTLAAE
jgi:uncharacterized OsmC-like protein